MRIAYLINQYPKVSHSFIRREILALERQGVEVRRIALRGWDGDLVDAEDLRERAATQYVLRGGMWPPHQGKRTAVDRRGDSCRSHYDLPWFTCPRGRPE